MPSQPRGKIDTSWIINDSEDADGNISWAEDSEPSDQEQTSHISAIKNSPKFSRSSPHTTGSHSISSATPPEFIMPSISEKVSHSKPPVVKRISQINMPSRDGRYASRTVSARSTPASRRSAEPPSNKAIDLAVGTGEFLLDIAVSTLKKLKQPISWVLAAYLFAGLLVLVQNLLTNSIYSAITPVCRIPGVSFLRLPICQSPYTSPDQPSISPSPANHVDPEFDALMTIQGKFETVLEDSAAGIALPLDMKRSETSIRDLRQVVRFSSIPSKNELLHEFDGFIETARIASYDLQKFNSHVGRAVDSVLSTARWTQRVLDDISLKTAESSGLVLDFINNRLLAPFQPVQFTESRLLEQYITHTRIISGEIEALIDEAQALLLVLTNLEDRLDLIHSISLRDNLATKSSRDEILGQLWTFLGGNRAKLGKVDNQLRLLARVGDYRKLAYAHVSGTILKLQAMGAELEELRTRIGSAELAEERGIRGIPLSVHLESIRLGVERLEGQREKAREVERSHVRRVVEKSASEEERLLVEG